MKQMLINAVHAEQKRMAIVEDGKLVEFNIQMSVKDPITGNVYKGIVQKVERGLQAAFVNYGGKRDGFLPLRDVGSEYFTDHKENGRPTLKVGQEVLVQIVREVGERKGALLTTYISLPGRYLVLLPNKQSSGISRKIEDEEDRKRLKKLVEQIRVDEGIGFIVRTAGMSRTKQELSRDYQNLSRLWREIQKRGKSVTAPALIYQESDFGICSLRDYFTSEINDILIDDIETFKKMREYCKVVVPKTAKIIGLYKEKTPIFDQYQLEDQIRIIYQEQVDLRSGGYIVINPTEAMITIDVNSGRASNKRNVEETAFKTNLEAAEEIARQLRLRDLGGLIVIDFIDMMDRKHDAEVEKAFKKALSVDRARIQLSRISKFGILELSRQKKQPTIQEISYTTCPFCKGSGVRPSLEYTALSAFRKIESQVVKGLYSSFKVTLPYEVSDYLLNQKRVELSKLEQTYDMSIHISGSPDIPWDMLKMESIGRTVAEALPEKGRQANGSHPVHKREEVASVGEAEGAVVAEPGKKKHRRRSRGRRKRAPEKAAEARPESVADQTWEEYDENVNYKSFPARTGFSNSPYASVATDVYTGVEEGDDPPERKEGDDAEKAATRQIEVVNIFEN
ncbi:MAG: Rne/Rng family ribonuclease [Syntrophaceae bacterium]|nr:Rne/Rng family ribonuclease [Syntrophaceae bacterium]